MRRDGGEPVREIARSFNVHPRNEFKARYYAG